MIEIKMGEKLIVDLNGPEGNVYYLMGLVKTIGVKNGLTQSEANIIVQKMTEHDYCHAVKVFKEHMSDLVELVGEY